VAAAGGTSGSDFRMRSDMIDLQDIEKAYPGAGDEGSLVPDRGRRDFKVFKGV
jgi:hypothetical protein